MFELIPLPNPDNDDAEHGQDKPASKKSAKGASKRATAGADAGAGEDKRSASKESDDSTAGNPLYLSIRVSVEGREYPDMPAPPKPEPPKKNHGLARFHVKVKKGSGSDKI